LLFALASILRLNPYLAAFVGGTTSRTLDAELVTGPFAPVANVISESLKIAATFLFGAFLSVGVFTRVPLSSYLFAAIVLLVERPVSVLLALIGSELDRLERLAAAWFGPKGFSSIVYGLLVLGSGVANSRSLFDVIAVVVVFSMVAHSSSDVAVAHRFEQAERERGDGQRAA
jgi:NhaP-type Na+/H+ or K+/H+ antiporter